MAAKVRDPYTELKKKTDYEINALRDQVRALTIENTQLRQKLIDLDPIAILKQLHALETEKLKKRIVELEGAKPTLEKISEKLGEIATEIGVLETTTEEPHSSELYQFHNDADIAEWK